MTMVLAISGHIAAGKSQLAKALAELLMWPRASFGDYIRAQARDRNLGSEREALQQLGDELIGELGWPEFCRRTLVYAELDLNQTPCIIEGIRHIEALKTLRRLFAPVPVRLIHVTAPLEIRVARLSSAGVGVARAHAWELHSTESDAREILPSAADLIVSSDDYAAMTVLAWVREHDI